MGNNTSAIVNYQGPIMIPPQFLPPCGLDPYIYPQLPWGVQIGNESKFEPIPGVIPNSSYAFQRAIEQMPKPCTWTCDDFTTYAKTFTTMSGIVESFTRYVGTSFSQYNQTQKFVLRSIALVLNILLCFTLASPKLDGSVFNYLRAIALANFGFCVFQLYWAWQYNLYSYLTTSEAVRNGMNAYAPFLAIFDEKRVPAYIEAAKLNVCVMTFFMNLDRFMAYMTPLRYDRLNTKKFFALAFVISLLVGCLELEQAFGNNIFEWRIISPNVSAYAIKQISNAFPFIYKDYISKTTATIKCIIVALCLVSTICIIRNIRARKRKIKQMLTPVTLVQETNKMIYLAKLQIIDTLLMIVDTLTSLYSATHAISEYFRLEIFGGIGHLGFISGTYCTVWKACAMTIFYGIFNLMDSLGHMYQNTGHGELFLIYLIFFKRFREAFFSNLKIVFYEAPKKLYGMIRIRCGHGATVGVL